MAITQGDGSIILTTKVDETGLNKSISSMKGALTKLGITMAAVFSVRALKNFIRESKELYRVQMENEVKLATVMRQRMSATDEQIQKIYELASAEQSLGVIGDEVQIAGLQQLATFAKQTDTLEKLLPAMNNLLAQQNGYEISTGSAVNVANLMGKVLQGQTGALTRVGITFSEAQEQVLKYGTESEKAATLAQVIKDNVGEMNKALANTDVGRQQQLANTFGDIKEQFGQAFTQIAIIFLPVLQKVANLLATVAKYAQIVAQYISSAFGAKSNVEQWKQVGDEIQRAAEEQDNLTEATTATAKAQEKYLAGFDKVSKISDNSTSGGATIEQQPSLDVPQLPIGADELSKQSDKIAQSMGNIMKIAGASLMAIGLILLVTGHPLWGIAFIIAGALLFVGGRAVIGKTDAGDKVATLLGDVMLVAGGALVAIGAILLTIGQTAWGIAFIIAGATIFGVGAATLAEGVGAEKVQEFIGNILLIGGSLMLVLGLMMVVTGHITPISIALIIAGASAIATEITLNWNEMPTKTKAFISAMMGILGTALLVLGILLLVTGAGIPLGLGLILAGAGSLAVAIAPNWNAIVEAVKGVFDGIVGIWKNAVENVMTFFGWLTDGWQAVGDALVNGLKAVGNIFVDIFNGFIKGLNKAIGAINKIPGVELKKLKTLPRLAEGAVIPPNKEFLAVLGDQKSGTNIEAPLSTIKQAVAEVLAGANMGGNGAETIELVVNLDGAVIYKSVVNRNKQNTIRTGKNALAY